MTRGTLYLRGGSRMAWIQDPCVFIHKTQTAGENACECCREPFGFWNGRTNCEFCGCVVHSKCTSKVRRTNTKRRPRICTTCCQYRDRYSPLLRVGDEFICYNNHLPAASYLYLSEEKRSLLITMDPTDEITEIPLDEIEYVQKGFSHAGHMNAAHQYDPLRCFSILTRSEKMNGCTLSYDLKTHSALHCQMWVNSLNTALFVYRRLVEQDEALEEFKAQQGHSALLLKKCVYFPEKRRTDDFNVQDDSMVIITGNEEGGEGPRTSQAPDLVVIDVDDNLSSRGSTPFSDIVEVTPPSQSRTSPVVRKAHYKIRTIASPYRMVVSRKSPQPSLDKLSTCSSQFSNDWRTRTTESMNSSGSTGLPYKGHRNPLASYCTCHAYDIEQSRAMLISSKESVHDSSNPFKSCCQQCRDKCRLLRDLSLF